MGFEHCISFCGLFINISLSELVINSNFSCLANGNADEFDRGEYLYQANAVHDVFQIGLLNTEFLIFAIIK